MDGDIHQQLLLANGRIHHELVQSVDRIHRQLTLRADYAGIQLPQVEGRIYHKLLQMAGNVHFQLLMANSFPSHYGWQDASQPVTVARGLQGTKEQDVSPLMDDVDGGLYETKEGTNVDGGHNASDVSRDVSPPANADGGYHGAKEQDGSPPVNVDGDHHGAKVQDVSPPANADGGHHGT